jgi:hypothetical protein
VIPVVPLYALGFNALLWLSRLVLAPGLAESPLARWGLTLLAPCAFFAALTRLSPERRPALTLVTAVSVATIGVLA